jgi:hypothetical protein
MSGIKGKSGIYNRTKPAWNKGKVGFMKGRKFSEEHKLKIADALKGNNNGFREVKQTKEELYRKAKNVRYEQKLKVVSYYSFGTMICNCCGENNFENLTIDHIYGGGNKHRLEIFGYKTGGSAFYFWLIMNGFPNGYQVLCKKCNSSKREGKSCKLHNKV